MTNLDSIPMFVNLLCHILIFVCAFYTAMHNRFINPVILTMLWYVGLASFFCGTTIAIDYVFGPDFPLSYSNLGLIAETVLNLSIAVTMAIIFALTVNEDFRARTRRRNNSISRVRKQRK